MSLQDDLTAVQRSLDDLVRSVGRLEQQVGASLDIRRVRTDTDHLRESVELLRAATAAAPAAQGAKAPASSASEGMVTIPDTPYDRAMWAGIDDLDDEGLGARDRHAP
ncbi:hypothetical protein [Streptomyces apocyni]|uniref:hypothetical protein n=1 Tax=Streptomyces apocyni TaxID=2654677 RepID=UPI0012EAA364|nr:hypothetical protein [Streptomyces apocyni]